MKRIIILLLLFVMAFCLQSTACGTEEITGTSTPTNVPTTTLATPTPSASPAVTSPALLLTVTQPLDGAQVSTISITVAGTTNPGAVVSVLVNDEITIADVDSNGGFSAAVVLEEGPNLIEVIASDQQGNEKSSTIAVIYIT